MRFDLARLAKTGQKHPNIDEVILFKIDAATNRSKIEYRQQLKYELSIKVSTSFSHKQPLNLNCHKFRPTREHGWFENQVFMGKMSNSHFQTV